MLLEVVMIVLFIVLGVGALLPAWWGWHMIVDYYWRTRVTPPLPEPCPNVTVILCLRGADPSLDACLRGLLNQDFPRYRVHFVIDNAEDRAYGKVQEILGQGVPPQVQVQTELLERPCPTCSLKVCSQLQAVSKLGADTDIVVLIDADSIPAADWLRAMVVPFADPKVGATTGIRWFAPVDRGWGSLIRHIFNTGSYPQMFAFDHVWGGSVALRAELFQQTTLSKRLGQAFCEDAAITGPVREKGLKIVWVPAATNTNQESVTLSASLRFIQRQLVCTRLDHIDWPILLACNMYNTFAIAALAVLTGVGVYLERWDWAGIAAGLIASFAVAMFAALNMAEFVIRRNYRVRGVPAPPMVWTWKMLPGFFFTQAVCMLFLWRAHNIRRVDWRGIEYAIDGPGKIRMEKYQPYQPPDHASAPHHSAM
ncbi:MAG: glycosyltransferase family 2 protein [Planctomycetes bacterium]|nr:glycosyltransferase family 2 protein [Planctomycetota bacterium]